MLPSIACALCAFLSTLSLRRATNSGTQADPVKSFLSTLSLRRATALGLPGWLRTLISIHALLAESDRALRQLQSALRHFYPRSPCGERPLTDDVSAGGKIFLSTLSLRRATDPGANSQPGRQISIHALLAESDFLPILKGFTGG